MNARNRHAARARAWAERYVANIFELFVPAAMARRGSPASEVVVLVTSAGFSPTADPEAQRARNAALRRARQMTPELRQLVDAHRAASDEGVRFENRIVDRLVGGVSLSDVGDYVAAGQAWPMAVIVRDRAALAAELERRYEDRASCVDIYDDHGDDRLVVHARTSRESIG